MTYQSGYLNKESFKTSIGFSQSLKEAEAKTLSSQAKTFNNPLDMHSNAPA